MKTLKSLFMVGLLSASALTFAAENTSMTSDWICTTNASSSDVEADKVADKKAADHAQSAADSFAFAAQHCRDCTKITCKYK